MYEGEENKQIFKSTQQQYNLKISEALAHFPAFLFVLISPFHRRKKSIDQLIFLWMEAV